MISEAEKARNGFFQHPVKDKSFSPLAFAGVRNDRRCDPRWLDFFGVKEGGFFLEREDPKYSVIVPVYNSEQTLITLHQRIDGVFASLKKRYELILVNDASEDGSARISKKLAEENENIIFIDLLRNFGQQNAILCGLSKATGNYIITLDDDLQNPPEEIPALIDALKAGDLEVVYGIPDEKKHQLHRNLGTKMVRFVIQKLFGHAKKGASSFRIMTRTIKDCILNYTGSFTFIDGLIFQHTSYVGYQVVTHNERQSGKSNYNFRRLAMLSMNLFFNFSIAPLRFVFVAGFLLAAAAGIFSVAIVIGKLTGYVTFTGWASTMTYLSLLFGALFMFLGLIGEYIGRIAQGINRAPQYSIRSVISKKKLEKEENKN